MPSELVADAFDLAREVRVLDMQASPYHLRDLGYDPVPIETAEGKATYLQRQRAFAERSNALRHRLLAVLESVRAAGKPREPRVSGVSAPRLPRARGRR